MITVINISKAINLFKKNLVNISAMMKNDNNCPPSQKSIKPIKIERTTRTSKRTELGSGAKEEKLSPVDRWHPPCAHCQDHCPDKFFFFSIIGFTLYDLNFKWNTT